MTATDPVAGSGDNGDPTGKKRAHYRVAGRSRPSSLIALPRAILSTWS